MGGRPGAAHGLTLNEGRPGERNLSLKAVGVELASGDSITMRTGGGGGYGPAVERDPAAVLRDVREGYVTAEQAREAYGVVIIGGTVDVEQTERRRLALNANGKAAE
jgi:N-methylhydantoinase B/oxoprolinase/acetone carboxylase alpha subunit